MAEGTVEAADTPTRALTDRGGNHERVQARAPAIPLRAGCNGNEKTAGDPANLDQERFTGWQRRRPVERVWKGRRT